MFTKVAATELLFASEDRYLLHEHRWRSGFILTLELEYGNKGGDAHRGYPAVQGGEKKKKARERGNTSAALHKRHAMCPRQRERGPGQAVKIIGEDWFRPLGRRPGLGTCGGSYVLISTCGEGGRGGRKPPPGLCSLCHLHRPPLCLWLTEGWGTDAAPGNWKSLQIISWRRTKAVIWVYL